MKECPFTEEQLEWLANNLSVELENDTMAGKLRVSIKLADLPVCADWVYLEYDV